MSIWTPMSLIDRIRSSVSSCESLENAKTTRSTSSTRTSSGSWSGVPRIAELAEPGRVSLGFRVDEAEHVDPVLGVLANLLGHELADVARPDDDRVLEIGDRPPAERARERTGAVVTRTIAASQNAIRRWSARIGEPGHLGGEEEHPASHRDEMEDADQVVGGRVVRSLLVGVVEAVEASSDEPERHRQEEDQDLRRVAHGVRPAPRRRT